MTKTLVKHGNSWALVIDKAILELLDIDNTTELDIKTDGVGLIIRPAQITHFKKVLDSASRLMDIHSETLKKLAE